MAQEREYAAPEDDEWLDAFLERLDRRDVHLRPGIKVSPHLALEGSGRP